MISRSSTGLVARCTIVVVVVVLLGGIIAGCSSDSEVPVQDARESEGKATLVTVLWAAGVLLALILLFTLPFYQSTWGEFVAAGLIVFLLLFYYRQPIALWLLGLSGEGPAVLLRTLIGLPFEALATVQDFLLERLPEAELKIGKLTILSLSTQQAFDTTLIPLGILVSGALIRLAVARYVRNERLRKITGEYWLYVLAYLILAYVLSAITNWSFIAIVFVFLLIFLVLALGIFRVGGDILAAMVYVGALLWTLLRIAVKAIVSLVTVFADLIRAIGRWIRELYERYIVAPIVRLYHAIVGYLEQIERRLDIFLGRTPRS